MSFTVRYGQFYDQNSLFELFHLFAVKSKTPAQMSDEQRYAKIETYLNALISSVEKSSAKSLPPINWYFLMTAFLKYDSEKRFEHLLVRITLLHLAHSKSACMLLKNLLIDTNSLLELRVSKHTVLVPDDQSP